MIIREIIPACKRKITPGNRENSDKRKKGFK